MCIECYINNNRITPLLNPINCLNNHTQYICGTCGRCICYSKTKNGLQRWNFPFKSLNVAKMYLRTANYTMKKPCSTYEIEKSNGKILYKIFVTDNDAQVYLNKNKCKNVKNIFTTDKYMEYSGTQIKKLTSDEIKRYMLEKPK